MHCASPKLPYQAPKLCKSATKCVCPNSLDDILDLGNSHVKSYEASAGHPLVYNFHLTTSKIRGHVIFTTYDRPKASRGYGGSKEAEEAQFICSESLFAIRPTLSMARTFLYQYKPWCTPGVSLLIGELVASASGSPSQSDAAVSPAKCIPPGE
ncbi:hypothetical protein M433DRAFT_136214 [Acidomyces richmondensis BFW]|nr:hypothetical protein M433DRAFT_136214 [Acidomyces richmondensis BFW]